MFSPILFKNDLKKNLLSFQLKRIKNKQIWFEFSIKRMFINFLKK